MKRIITIIIAMLLLLSGCNSTQSNQTEIANEETEQRLSDQTDTPSELVTELPTELTKIKKTVETWTGGTIDGYLSLLEEYDENGKIIKRINYHKDNSISSSVEWIRENDSFSNTVTENEKDSEGEITFTTIYKYDASGNLIELIHDDPEERIMTTTYRTIKEYDSDGKISKETVYDKNGNISYSYEYEYDSQGNLIKSLRNGKIDDEWKYEYNESGQIVEKWKKITQDSEFKLIEAYSYTPEGYMKQKIKYNSDGLSVTYTYNEDGTLIDEYGWPSFSDETVHKKYNEKGLLLEESYTTNHTKKTTYAYDENENLIREDWYDDWDGGSSGLTEYAITYWN